MIRIRKPLNAPAVLQSAPTMLAGGAFHRHVYAHASVVEELKRSQFSKCCFCEQKVPYGDVEHYRPKAIYYWLTYDWDNLFWCCSTCNSRHKRGDFPLDEGCVRCSTIDDDLTSERPLFLHPAHDDPEIVIGWRYEVPFPLDGDRRAQATIDALRLREEPLNEIRREHLRRFRDLWDALTVARQKNYDTAARLDRLIREDLQDSAPFAAMVRAMAARLGA